MTEPPQLADKAERKRLVRAVWAYSGLEVKELAAAAGLSPATVRGYVGRGDRSYPTLEAAIKIADAAGVPRDFVQYGFERSDALSVLTRGLLALAPEHSQERPAEPTPRRGADPPPQRARADGE